jgi:hypothetical protein
MDKDLIGVLLISLMAAAITGAIICAGAGPIRYKNCGSEPLTYDVPVAWEVMY